MKRIFSAVLGTIFLFVLMRRDVEAAGVTLVTHGHNSSADTWVRAMAEAITRYRGARETNATLYLVYFTVITNTYIPTWTRLAGPPPPSTSSAEIVVMLDWRDLADSSYDTETIGPVVAYYCLIVTNFISELNGHALAEFPLHLAGHSRGGSLVAEIAKHLGRTGIWVDQLSLLDAYPIPGKDSVVRIYENVLWCDNYYQRLNILIRGNSIFGAYNRKLNTLGGGYFGVFEGHSDVHLWYHGTIDWDTPSFDNTVAIMEPERQTWWTPSEARGTNAGFYYSRFGAGSRLATNEPAGVGLGRPIDGMSQRFDFGAGTANNRAALSSFIDTWPNPITLALANTNVVYCTVTNALTLRYQWGETVGSNATSRLYLDRDKNPLNSNELLVASTNITGTGFSSIGVTTNGFQFNLTGVTPATLYPFVILTSGNKRRYLYTGESISYRGGCNLPTLSIARITDGNVRVEITAGVGESVVLESANSFPAIWQSVATNVFGTNRWAYTNSSLSGSRFFRALVK